ncbi:hypothetical protein AAIH46_17925 [Rhizobium sp. 0TCS1.26]|uniref:hypothetical protein n=1 Tax=Rhizobium sp. 0TCS1.26 TaxID=3142623 RepID=UPI003D2806E9
MTTKQTLSTKVDQAANAAGPREDGRSEYHLKPGVAWINGKRAGTAKTVFLNDAEAAYDLSLDRVAPADKAVPDHWAASDKKPRAGGAADGGD